MSCFQAYLSTTLSNKFDKHENILLIVTFSDKQYHNLPLMEVLYRHHFKNILYCGKWAFVNWVTLMWRFFEIYEVEEFENNNQ